MFIFIYMGRLRRLRTCNIELTGNVDAIWKLITGIDTKLRYFAFLFQFFIIFFFSFIKTFKIDYIRYMR